MCRLQNHAKVTHEAKVKERQAEKKLHEQKRTTVMKEVSRMSFMLPSLVPALITAWQVTSM